MNCEVCNLKELVNSLLPFLDQFIVSFVFLFSGIVYVFNNTISHPQEVESFEIREVLRCKLIIDSLLQPPLCVCLV